MQKASRQASKKAVNICQMRKREKTLWEHKFPNHHHPAKKKDYLSLEI